jgi:hypothetical protein
MVPPTRWVQSSTTAKGVRTGQAIDALTAAGELRELEQDGLPQGSDPIHLLGRIILGVRLSSAMEPSAR